MKKCLVVIVTVLALAANAAWEKVGVVQVADVNALVAGISKLGEFTGNQMIGLMASSSVAEMPCAKLFGPGRVGTPFALSLLSDDAGNLTEFAYLYPIAKTQAEFLALHPGTVGQDGVIELKAEEDGDNEPRYVKFSADGQWVAYSDKRDQLDPALKDIRVAAQPMKGDLVRLVVGKSGMKTIRQIFGKKAEAEGNASGEKRIAEILKDCESLVAAIAVDGKGLAMRGTLNAAKGTKLAQCGLKPLADNPFAFAGKDALMANAIAADCGQSYFDLNELRSLLAKHGIKTDFLAVEEKGENISRLTLDIPAAVAYFKAETNIFEKITSTELKADSEKLFAGQDAAFTTENPAMAMSLAIKDYETTATPAERVKTVLPEIAGKKPYSVQVWSLYATMKAVLPYVVDAMEADEKAMFEPILATLPSPGNGGIATAIWREKGAHKFVVRISSDEFKSVSAGFSAFMVYQMQKHGMPPQGVECTVIEDSDDE